MGRQERSGRAAWLAAALTMAMAGQGAAQAQPAPDAPAATIAAPEGPEAVFAGLAGEVGASPAQVHLITDNREAWYARWYVLGQAHHTIDTTYFCLDEDVYGRAFLGALFDKARQGVSVRLMIDAHGNGPMAERSTRMDVLQEMATLPNIQVRVFNPIKRAIFSTLLDIRGLMASDHDKILVVDGEWVVVGGRNISIIHLASPLDEPHANRDTDVLIRGGDIPAQARAAFEHEFLAQEAIPVRAARPGKGEARARELEISRLAMDAAMMGVPQPAGDDDLAPLMKAEAAEIAAFPHLAGFEQYQPFQGEAPVPALLLSKGSHRDNIPNAITPNVMRFIDSARQEIVLQNPYVVLTREGKEALERAARRGVKVTLNTNTPLSTNHLMTQATFFVDWKELLERAPGMRIFGLKGEALLHAKVFVIDRKVALIGSYNLDPISQDINAEDVAAVLSPAFAQQNAQRIFEDCANSTEYRIQIGPDGKVDPIVGPGEDLDDKLLRRVEEMIPIARLLRPLL